MVEALPQHPGSNGQSKRGAAKDSSSSGQSSGQESRSVQEPIELLQMSLGGLIMIKLRHGRELTGRLVAYDDHLNLMVSDAREKLTTKEKVDDGRGG